jgi:hypothetical protein
MTWNPTDFASVLGGDSEIVWTYTPPNSAPQQYNTFYFVICGENPDVVPAANALLVSRPTNAPYTQGYWFAPNIANHETGMAQFYRSSSQGAQAGDPQFGPPAGYGMMQLEFTASGSVSYSVDDIWKWTTNVTDVLKLMDANAHSRGVRGNLFWLNDVALWQQALVAGRSNAQEPIEKVQYPPPTSTNPNPTPQLSCTFRALDPGSGQPLTPLITSQPNTYWYADANVMKANGGGPAYIRWNNSDPQHPFWEQHKISNNGEDHNFVYEFCTCQASNTSCQRHTTENGQKGGPPISQYVSPR